MDGSALVLWWKICVVVGITVVGCHAESQSPQTQQNRTTHQYQKTWDECFECNSEYDPRCGDPFDSNMLASVNCTLKRKLEHLPNMNPVLCQKTIQNVRGKIRVIRGCGYIRDERDDKGCYSKIGTNDVDVTYCACTYPRCNTGHVVTEPSIISVLAAILAAWVAKLIA